MNILHYAIDRPRVVCVLLIVTAVAALFAAFDIPVQRTPAIHTAVVVVAVPYPGSKPDEVEDQITRKIEERLQRLDRVDWMQSGSERGASILTIVFEDGVEPQFARTEVEHLVNEVRSELPLGREVQPQIITVDFDNLPIMRVTLAGPAGFDQRALKTIAEEVQEELEVIPGVANTSLFGGHEREIHINYHPDLLHQYGISLADLRTAMQNAHRSVPGGSLNTAEFDLQVRNESKFRQVSEIGQVVVKEISGRVIRIADVAEVLDHHKRPTNRAQLDGRESATIIVNKEPDINVLGACQQVRSCVDELQTKYPHLTFSCTGDVSQEIRIMFWVLGTSALYGGFLVFLSLYLSMGMRVAILVSLAIPFSTAVTVVFLYLCGIAVSNMVIFSYILAVGMVVDGAIIVGENIHRHMEMGKDPAQAAKDGIDEVAIPVFSADLTTIAAFLPMLLIPGIMGDFMGVMPQVVSVALAGSMVVDHLVLPMCAAVWYRAYPIAQQGHFKPGEEIPEGTSSPLAGTFLAWPVQAFVKAYAVVLRYSLRNRLVVLAICGLGVAWAGLMLSSGAIAATFFPPSDRGQFTVAFELPLGYSLDQTEQAAQVLIQPLKKMQENGEVVHFVTAIGSSSMTTNPLDGDTALGPEFGRISVELTPPMNRDRHQDAIIDEYRKAIGAYPGLKYTIRTVQEGPPGGSAVAIRLTGDDLDELGRLGNQLAQVLRDIPGTLDVKTTYRPDSPELVVKPDPAMVGLLGMNSNELSAAIATAVLGDNSLEMVLDDEEVPLRLQAVGEYQRYPDDIRRLMIATPSGRMATIGQVASVTHEQGLYNIVRRDRRRAVEVTCDVISKDVDPERGLYPGDVFAKLRTILPEQFGFRPSPPVPGILAQMLQMVGVSPANTTALSGPSMAFLGQPGSPAEGVRAEFTGENEEQQENTGHLATTMVLAIVLIGGILVIQFNSFRQTAVVLAAIPLSFIGVIGGMWLCDLPFSLPAFIGLVSLTGIVVNDAIVMVDFANARRARGVPLYGALIEAGETRLRPVFLTTITTIGGLFPLFLNLSGGAEFWQPLTAAIIFGLSLATLLTLVVIPVLYSLSYDPFGSQRAREFAAAESAERAPHEV